VTDFDSHLRHPDKRVLTKSPTRWLVIAMKAPEPLQTRLRNVAATRREDTLTIALDKADAEIVETIDSTLPRRTA
jgi:hypothetical protein